MDGWMGLAMEKRTWKLKGMESEKKGKEIKGTNEMYIQSQIGTTFGSAFLKARSLAGSHVGVSHTHVFYVYRTRS